jgi:branched-chain amino acid transport system permease protein
LDGRPAVRKLARDVFLILLPVVATFALLPSVYGNQLLLFNFIIFIVLAQGVNVIYGFTGYLPFGYVGFFGAGAYGFSLMVLHLQAPPFLAIAVGAAAALVLALVLTPLFRLSGAYFSIANLAAALAVLQVVANPNLEDYTRGPYGISLSGIFNPPLAYAVAVAILAATLFIVIFLRHSKFGLALQAIREDTISAGMAGINVVRERVIAWLLSALIAGLAGSVFAWYASVFYAETVFSGEYTIFAIVFALFGGTATVVGPILGVVILYGIYNAVGISTPQYFQLIYGALIIGLVLFLPNGLVSILRRWGIDVP